MFKENIYTKVYFALMNKAKTRTVPEGYTETHHIIPKSLGGSDQDSNLAILTAREHYISHLLLCKMTEGSIKFKMLHAAKLMSTMRRDYQDRYVPKSKIYEWIKSRAAEEQSIKKKGKTYEELYGEEKAKELRKAKSLPRGPRPKEVVEKIAKKNFGKKRTEEQKLRMSQSQKNRTPVIFSEEQKQEISKKISNALKGRKKTEEQKRKISESLKGKTKGIPKSEETKAKMRKPKSEEFKQKLRKPKTPEHVQAILEAKRKKKVI